MNTETKDQLRLEVKFVTYKINYQVILNWIASNPFYFRRQYDDRIISNIYFDTYDAKAYSDNLIGISERTKLRYRWYGSSLTPDRGTLEVKRRKNVFGWKNLFPVPQAPYEAGFSWQAIRNSISSQIPTAGKMWLDANPANVLKNQYSRRYFISDGDLIRITVDKNMKVWDQRYKRIPNFSKKANVADTVVVEIKFRQSERDIVTRLIKSMPIRVGKHSKFVTGVLSL